MLKLTNLNVTSSAGISDKLYGLDEHGAVWQKIGSDVWTKVDMSTGGCPTCSRNKSEPLKISSADGHGRLNQYCSDKFHFV